MLSASVGQGGTNITDDVKVVQRLLGDLQIAAGLVPLDDDGVVGPLTIAAISAFQEQEAGLPDDGRIDPGGPTFTRVDEVCADLYATIIQFQGLPVLAEPMPPGTPPDIATLFDDIRADFAALVPTEPVAGAENFEDEVPQSFVAAANVRSALLGTAQAIPLILVLIFILALLIVMTSNPIWQRAAKQTIQGLKDRLRLLSEKIRDAVQQIIDSIEEVIGGTACAEACAEEVNKIKDLQRQLNDLLDRMPANDNDPQAMKELRFQIIRLHEQILAAYQDVVDCLQQHGC
jgi:uncharacterized coiled-coil protein SlyX